MQKIQSAGAMPQKYFALADCSSPWKTKLFIEVTKEVPETKMAKFSGKFLSKVFEGSFKETGQFAQEMKSYVASKNKELEITSNIVKPKITNIRNNFGIFNR